MAHDGPVIDGLDIKFCQILTAMKEDIVNINDPKLIKQYTIWLDTLTESKSIHKGLRNRYLLELAHQVHKQVLRPPFTSPPTRTRLHRIKRVQKKESHSEGWPNFKTATNNALDRKYSSKNRKQMGEERNISSLQSDNSSWIDLTDSSIDCLACGDTDGDIDEENKTKLGVEHVSEGKKLKEHYLQKYEEEFIQNVEETLGNGVNKSEVDLEVDALKLRMKDLLEVKKALRDTHSSLAEDRKKTNEALHLKLVDAQKKHNHLRTALTRQSKALAEKQQEINELKQKCTSTSSKELELLKHRHLEEKQNMEITYQNHILAIQSEFQQQLEVLKSNYEGKINEVVRTNSIIIKEKDAEIIRLQLNLKSREELASAEGSYEQVNHLKKCISKLDKLSTKNEREYLRKLEKLKQELELKEMSTQIQLQTQRADLMLRYGANKKEELEGALNSLENKYRNIVANLQNSSSLKRQQNDQVIAELRRLIEDSICSASCTSIIAE